MKSNGYTLTNDAEQKDLKLEQLEADKLDRSVINEAMIHAGIDKYVGGVGFFRLQVPWRGHAKDSLVVRHVNSAGVQVTVCESDASTSTPAADEEAAKAAAAKAAAELEAQREAQQQKDAPPAPAPEVQAVANTEPAPS